MLTNTQKQMFEFVARSAPQLREWLHAELEQQVKLLINVVDTEQLRRAQGHAQCLTRVIAMLDLPASPPAKPSPRPQAGS